LFPDFSGAVTAASSVEDAVELAAEALALHVEGMLAEGEKIPPPSDFDHVRTNTDYRDGYPVLMPFSNSGFGCQALHNDPCRAHCSLRGRSVPSA
jgi:predicted RNase H-like HicB family nuclease